MAENISVVQKFKIDEEYRKDFIYGSLIISSGVCLFINGLPAGKYGIIGLVGCALFGGIAYAESQYRKRLAKSE